MTKGYQCSICGTVHEGLVSDKAFKLPDVIWAIPEHERTEQARFTSDLCQWGERYFIRCILYIPFTQTEGTFGWGAWCEVEWPVFERYLDFFDADGNEEPPKSGKLANALPPYDNSLGTDVEIQFRGPSERPTLHLLDFDNSDLAQDQRHGIDNVRWHAIVEWQ
jgi:hypothetical protein